MEKSRVSVRIAGKEFTFVTEDTPAYMQRVAAYVDRKLQEMSHATRMPVNQVMIPTAIDLADELLKAQDENARIRRELVKAQEALAALGKEHHQA